MATLFNDLHFASRSLLRTPAFVAIVVLLLGFAFGTSACVFSVTYGLLYKPLPFANAERLATVYFSSEGQNAGLAPPLLEELSHQPKVLERVAGYRSSELPLDTQGSAPVRVTHAQPQLFDLLGAHAAVGRLLAEADGDSAQNADAVLDWNFAEARFGSAETALGKMLNFKQGEHHRIVGVLPRNFRFDGDAQMWLVLHFAPNERGSATDLNFNGLKGIARLAPGMDFAAARNALTAQARNFLANSNAFDPHQNIAMNAAPLRSIWLGDRQSSLEMMLLAVALLMLVTGANVCNLHLARACARQHEMALLDALGASTQRRLRLLMSDAVLLCSWGAIGGILMFPLGLHWLRRFDLLPTNTPQRIGIDATTLTFVAALAVVLALAMTLSARWLQSANTFTTLKQGGTRQSAGTTAQRTRQVLVILQIGMTAALLVGTGLLLRSAHHLLNEDVGFNRDGLLIASLNLSPADADAAGLHAPVCSICERAASLPGVSKVGISNFAPFGGSSYASDYQAPDSTVTDAAATRIAYYNSNVSADYFSALGLPIVSGRAFSADEVRNASPVAIVDGDFVKRNFGDRNPIGQTFLARGGKRVTIIGVAATVKRATLNETIERPTIYLPGMEGNDYQILVRTKIDPATLIPSLKAMIHELAPTASLDGITTMSALIESTIADRTRLNTLLELLGAVALVLAAVGLYAVLAYAVRMRRSEFGIRLALGAAPARVTREVLAQGLRLVAIGLGLGLPLAYAAAQLIAARLYRTTPLDPPTLIVVALLIAAIGLLASWWPARNAARVDPMTALRQE